MRLRTRSFGLVIASLLGPLSPVTPAASPPPTPAPSFMHDVLPIFMRHGCNAGDCHGAARGKDGFMLSLFGYDPDGDYYRLLEELPGRRVNIAAPEQSLLLQKATGAVPHTGGECFTADSEPWRIIRDWIAARAPNDPPETPTIEGIRMEPRVIEFAGPTGKRPTKVWARYSDGTERDVARWALFLSSNSGVVDIDDNGTLLPRRPGGAHVSPVTVASPKGPKSSYCPQGPLPGIHPTPETTSTNGSTPNSASCALLPRRSPPTNSSSAA